MISCDVVSVYAPGSIGNVGPGLDILGLALAGAGDEVTLRRTDGKVIRIVESGGEALPTDPERHTAAVAAAAVFQRLGVPSGCDLMMHKGLPLSGGQGGSAASAVAGAVAANHLVAGNLDAMSLLECALVAESRSSGRHADNLAPSLLGGLVLVRSIEPLDIIALPVPLLLRIVLISPDQRMLTREARAVLPREVPLETAVHQAAQVAAMVAGAFLDDVALFGRAIEDRIAEPVRLHLLPGFVAARRAALEAGAHGCSISGAGPSAFAVVDSEEKGERVLDAMLDAYRSEGMPATGRVTDIDRRGAWVMKT